MQRFFPGRSKEDTKILNAYCEMRLKVEEAEKLLVELVEHPEFDDAMAAGPEFKEVREAAQERRARIADLEMVLAARGLYDAGLKYVTTGKKK
jgi:hypothetical protein